MRRTVSSSWGKSASNRAAPPMYLYRMSCCGNPFLPHAVSQYAEKSFICALHNDMPIVWKDKRIHFVRTIGITQQEMKYFKDVFHLIVELFSSTSRTLDLLKTDSFKEFWEQMY